MKRLAAYIFSFLMLFGILSQISNGQTYEERRQKIIDEQTNTRAEINVLDARIKTYEQRINQSQNKYQELYKQYENLNRLISLQDNKLGTLELEQQQIQEEIQITNEEIELREIELEKLIQNYKDILLYTYKNGRTSNLELVLSSESINQMLVRSYYLQKFEEQKVKQAEQIRIQSLDLGAIKDDKEQSLIKNELILSEIRDEKSKLSNQQTVQRQSVEKIKTESSNLLTELRRIRQQK